MKNLVWIVFSLFSSGIVSAQINYAVVGKINTQEGYKPSGNVIALSAIDSSFITGDFFLDGYFRLEQLNQKELIIQLTSLEFEDTFLPISFAGDTLLDLGLIELDNSSIGLDEVLITSRKPVYIQQADGTMAVLVENSSLAASNSVNELLSKSPDVLVNEDGLITVFGKGAAVFYLNGKRIDQNQLRLISPSTIKKLVIIRNPSAKYDAEGSAVIDIQTIQNKTQGYQVNLKQNASYSSFAGLDTYSEIGIAFNKGHFSSKLNYSLLKGNDRHILHTTRNRNAEDVFIKTDLTTEWKSKFENFSNYGFGVQYDYGLNSYLSLEYSGSYEQLGGNQLSTNIIEDKSSTNYYESDMQRMELDNNNSLSLNLKHALDTLGSHFFLGGQYSNFKAYKNNPIDEQRIEFNGNLSRRLKNLSELNIDILSGQLDFNKIFKNKSSLEVGAKYSVVDNGSDFEFFLADTNNVFIPDPLLSNQFSYRESITAAYLSFNGQFKNSIQYAIGLRSEYTNYKLQLSHIEWNNINDQYLDFFPQASLTKLFNKNNSINLSYASRIRRVPYQRLNPVLLYQDPYTSIQGNPESIPEKTHAFEINTKLNQTILKVGYTYTIDPFGGGAIRGEDEKSYILIRLNFNSKHRFYTSISKTFETSWLSSTNTVSLRYTDIIDREHNFKDVGSKPNLYLYSNNRFPVGNWFNAELSFYYIGDNDEGLYKRKNSWNLSLTLDKTFFDKALTCRIIANDLFQSVRAAGDYSIGPTDIYFGRKWNTNYLRFSASYNFGKLKKNNFKNKEIGSDEKNRIR